MAVDVRDVAIPNNLKVDNCIAGDFSEREFALK